MLAHLSPALDAGGEAIQRRWLARSSSELTEDRSVLDDLIIALAVSDCVFLRWRSQTKRGLAVGCGTVAVVPREARRDHTLRILPDCRTGRIRQWDFAQCRVRVFHQLCR